MKPFLINPEYFCYNSIGYAIAKRLGLDGASVMVSSRRQQNVQQAVEKLKEENINVAGTVCHVGKGQDRTHLIQEVGTTLFQCTISWPLDWPTLKNYSSYLVGVG